MLNEEKIALMTKLAAYEEREGKKYIPLSKYRREDYVGLKMINTALVVTLSYILILAVVIMVNIEQLMVDVTTMDYVQVGKDLLTWYVVVMVFYMVVSYIVYTVKFRKVRSSLNEYNSDLKKLYMMYKEEENNGNRGSL